LFHFYAYITTWPTKDDHQADQRVGRPATPPVIIWLASSKRAAVGELARVARRGENIGLSLCLHKLAYAFFGLAKIFISIYLCD